MVVVLVVTSVVAMDAGKGVKRGREEDGTKMSARGEVVVGGEVLFSNEKCA